MVTCDNTNKPLLQSLNLWRGIELQDYNFHLQHDTVGNDMSITKDTVGDDVPMKKDIIYESYDLMHSKLRNYLKNSSIPSSAIIEGNESLNVTAEDTQEFPSHKISKGDVGGDGLPFIEATAQWRVDLLQRLILHLPIVYR